jgi:hypothetical protein
MTTPGNGRALLLQKQNARLGAGRHVQAVLLHQ